MKARTAWVAVAMLTVLLLGSATSSWAQAKMWMTPSEIFAVLKPGQWVKVEGTIQKDFSAWCTEMKILTGDFLDDEWSMSTIIKKIDPEKQVMEMLHVPVKLKKDAEFQGALKSFSDIKAGMLLDVDGTYLKDGTFLAKEVEDESFKLTEKPEIANEIEVKGKIEKIDTAKNTVTIMGITFRITEKTKSKSVIK